MSEPAGATDLIRLKVRAVLPDSNTDTQIVLLQDERETEVLPIWVGMAEGNAIKFALEGLAPQRPLTHDLIKNFTEHLSVKVTQAVVADVKNNTYFAQVYLLVHGVEQTLDARPSDAIALALRSNSPIYATQAVLEQRGGGNLGAWMERFGAKDMGKAETS